MAIPFKNTLIGRIFNGLNPGNQWLSAFSEIDDLASLGWGFVDLAQTSNLAGTYDATAETLTVTATGALIVDSVAVAVGDRILLQNQTTGAQRGIYVVTVAGAVSVHPVLTRANDCRASGDFAQGKVVSVLKGTANHGKSYICTFTAPFALDTSTPSFTATAATVSFASVQSALAAATGAVDFNAQALTGLGNLTFTKETAATVKVADTTTAATAGAALSVAAGKSSTTGTGGAASLTGGAGDTTAIGGTASLVGGAGGSVGGAGGATAVTGGAASAGNAAGGASALTGGVGHGSSAGGAASVAGGVGGSSGAGGAASLAGGASGGATAAGGAVTVTGGAGLTTGAGGALVAAGGAGGNDAVGGLASLTGGAAGGGNRAGGAASVVGGAGAGSAAGGATTHTGGAGGATGAGGAASLTGGVGGATSGTGGAVSVAGGAGSGGNANGGAVTIRGGAKNGGGAHGTVTIGDSNTSAVKVGQGNLIADPGNAGAIPVTFSGSCAITTAGAETRTVADPTFIDQVLAISFDVKVGNVAITFASAINAAGNTIWTGSAAGQALSVRAVQVASALKWRLPNNDGGALS